MSQVSGWWSTRFWREHRWGIASCGVLLAGAVMRWTGLARFPMEQDEIYTLQESTELFATTLRPGIDARPLYYLLHHALAPLLPAGEFGARLPAFVFGILGLLITWSLGKYLAGRAGGFVALTLCAFSPWHLFVSGEARYWSLIYLLAAATLLLLLKARETDRWRTHAAAGALIVLGALTHPTFLFPLVGIGALLVLQPDGQGFRWRWPSRRSLLGTWLPAAIVIGGYLLVLRLTGRGSTVSNFGGRGLLSTLRLLPAMVQLTTMPLVAAAFVGIFAALYSETRARSFAMMAAGGALAGTGLLLLASTRTNVYADYGVAMLPLIIASATCLLLLPGLSRVGPWALGITTILVASMLPETVSQLSDGMRYDYRPALQRIAADSLQQPALVWRPAVQRYYSPTLRVVELTQELTQLDSTAATTGQFWVVALKNREGLVGNPDHSVVEWFRVNCDEELSNAGRRFDYRMYRVVLFSCRGMPAPSTHSEQPSRPGVRGS